VGDPSAQFRQTGRWVVVALILSALIVGIWFRFYHLDRKVYWIDEVFTSLRIAGYTLAEVKAEPRPLDAQQWRQFQTVGPDRTFSEFRRALLDDIHPPLYFTGARWWALWLGSSVWDVRCFSAVISLLAFPCLHWLCRELFDSQAVSWTALVLLALSPFHVLYAQEARSYSLWMVTLLLSSAALLRALRVGSKLAWALYGVAILLALYTHWLSVMLIPGHGLYVWATSGERAGRTAVSFGLAVGLAAVGLAPWLAMMDRVPGPVFTRRAIPVVTFAERSLMNVSSVFFDPQVGRPGVLFDVYGRDVGLRWTEPSTYVIVLIAVLAAYALRALYRETPRRVWMFVFVLIGVCVVFLGGPDLVRGGQRSTTGRFLIPAYIGIQLAVASCLAPRITGATESAGSRWAWRLVLAVLVSVGFLSCSVSSQAVAWWNKYESSYLPDVTRVINSNASPLVLVGSPIPLLVLSHVVHTGVMLQLTGPVFMPPPTRFDNIFVHYPQQPQFAESLAARTGYRMTLANAPARFWRIERVN
jgi:uncharacterized membrane protein